MFVYQDGESIVEDKLYQMYKFTGAYVHRWAEMKTI